MSLACGRIAKGQIKALLGTGRCPQTCALFNSEDARTAFEAGCRHAARVELPCARSLLDDAYGCFLRRAGERKRARARLEGAQNTYLRLGARRISTGWSASLPTVGSLRPRTGASRLELTPQEQAVGRLVPWG
jgi:hypothetical protein